MMWYEAICNPILASPEEVAGFWVHHSYYRYHCCASCLHTASLRWDIRQSLAHLFPEESMQIPRTQLVLMMMIIDYHHHDDDNHSNMVSPYVLIACIRNTSIIWCVSTTILPSRYLCNNRSETPFDLAWWKTLIPPLRKRVSTHLSHTHHRYIHDYRNHTLSVSCKLAPRSNKYSTIETYPPVAADIRAVYPSYIKTIQKAHKQQHEKKVSESVNTIFIVSARSKEY